MHTFGLIEISPRLSETYCIEVYCRTHDYILLCKNSRLLIYGLKKLRIIDVRLWDCLILTSPNSKLNDQSVGGLVTATHAFLSLSILAVPKQKTFPNGNWNLEKAVEIPRCWIKNPHIRRTNGRKIIVCSWSGCWKSGREWSPLSITH